MPDTSLRYLAMLAEIPAAPRKIDVATLVERLVDAGHAVSRRTVERDLARLSRVHALDRDDGHPEGWSWRKGEAMRFPAMDLETAFGHELLARHLTPLLPRTFGSSLQENLREAHRVMARHAQSTIAHWSRRIEALPPGQALLAPAIPAGVAEVVYAALLRSRQFHARYRSMQATRAQRYRFHPHGLVYRAGVLYLVARTFDHLDLRSYALHRMDEAEPSEAAAVLAEDFDLRRYLHEDKAFDLPVGGEVRLQLRVSPWLARYLGESRLSADQEIKPLRGSERLRLTATVRDTGQLEWWLRSFGAEVEVRAPAALRRRLAQGAAATAALYRQR